MSKMLVCERCNNSFEILGLVHPTHIQNQGTFGALCKRCREEATTIPATDWEAIAISCDDRLKVIAKLIRELSDRMSESSYLSHEQSYKVSCEIDELIKRVGL